MSILHSLVMGHALHAHNGATAVDPALVEGVRLTLNEIMRGLQILFICALFYGVVRLFLSFIRKATTYPCAHGYADTLDCLDCSHPDWFEDVERERLAPMTEWDSEPVSSTCEDYPCCGHTDGLGCDWVSPNEVQPCQEIGRAHV